ncbi:hypothetical protein JCM9492_04910 [Aquifex pyrophilus]
MRAFFLVSLFLILLSCSRPVEVKENPVDFFIKNYEKGIYRYKVEETKGKGNERCEVVLKDLIKGKEYKLELYTLHYIERYLLGERIYCELFSENRFLEVAGERFVPPSGLRVVNSVKLRNGLYLWITERVKASGGGGGGGGIIFLPMPWGGSDYGRYTLPGGGYGGK